MNIANGRAVSADSPAPQRPPKGRSVPTTATSPPTLDNPIDAITRSSRQLQLLHIKGGAQLTADQADELLPALLAHFRAIAAVINDLADDAASSDALTTQRAPLTQIARGTLRLNDFAAHVANEARLDAYTRTI